MRDRSDRSCADEFPIPRQGGWPDVEDLPTPSSVPSGTDLHSAVAPMRIAMVGTRGVPAAYGGFETAVEEVGRRLVQRGHDVTVYCRGAAPPVLQEYLGMRLVHLPALQRKQLETLTHTAVSAGHLFVHGAPDVAIVFNAANAPFVPFIRARGVPVATHMDGLEWRRSKWGQAGRRYYRLAEALAVRWSDALIADAQGIQDYYRDEFGTHAELITYGAPLLPVMPSDGISALGLHAGQYHLVVARFEPENHVHTSVEGMLRSTAKHPLVVVGAAPYADEYSAQIRRLAERDSRVRLLGYVRDQQLLDQLYSHALTYVHGHSVGGTNPSLLRAMGAQTAVLALDVTFNREVLGAAGRYFSGPEQLATLLVGAEGDLSGVSLRAKTLRSRAAEVYCWDDVATRYERLCDGLRTGVPQRSGASGRRNASGW